MQTENDDLLQKNDYPIWSLIAEHSISEGIADEDMGAELSGGTIIQAMRVLGLSPETLNKIRGTIACTVRTATSSNNTGDPGLPALICLFCERTVVNSACHAEDHLDGGWGFYVIEKGRVDSNTVCQEGQRVVELYLYREGKVSSKYD